MEKKILIEDILLKMNYDLSKTLTENKNFVTEQAVGFEQSLDRKNQQELNQAAEKSKQQLKPGEVDVSNEYMKVPGHWALATPYGYIWVPEGTKYKLFTGNVEEDNKIFDWSGINTELKKKGFPCVGKITPELVSKQLLKKDTCRVFWLPTGERYYFWWKVNEICQLSATGYLNTEDNSWYKSPKVIDTRNDWQKFLDEHGVAFQIAGSLIVAILGTVATAGFGAPASMAILLEVLGEMAINIPVGIRELEKGENISASISFLFAVLPLIKTAAGLGKISDEMAKNLSEKLAKENITNNAEMTTFIKTLSKEEQQAMNIMLKQDPKNLIKVTENTLNTDVKNWLKTNRKELLGKLPLTKREWAKSLGVDIITTTPLMIYKVFYGKELNAEEARKLNGFILSFPKESQEQVVTQLVNDPKLIEQAINNPDETKKYIESLKPKFETGVIMTPQQSDSASLSGLEYINNHLDDILGNTPESKK